MKHASIRRMAFRAGAVLALSTGLVDAAAALDLAFPAPSETTAVKQDAMTSFRLPVGPYRDGSMTTELAEGAMQQSAWRIAAPELSTLQLMQPLRAQIVQAGFKLLFECETQVCGGFDFRYGTAILPEPDMHVDLGDFRYLAAERTGPRGKEYVSLVVSRSPQDGFVQLTQIGQQVRPAPVLTASTKSPDLPALVAPAAPQLLSLPVKAAEPAPPVASATPSLAAGLDQGQPQVLEDLSFASGSAELTPGDYASLAALADWLRANPEKTIEIVGHTDASGGLATNLALSKQRAESVRGYLLAHYDLPAAQIAANGVGYLAPRDTNATETGRQRNRRVEVLVTSTL